MQIILLAFVSLVFMSSLCVLHAAAVEVRTFQRPDPATEKVIQGNLDRLKKTFGPQNGIISDAKLSKLRELGFESTDQLAKATIGQGFPLYVVRLDKLRGYDKGTDPWSLLTKADVSIYPLLVQGKDLEVRSSATISYQNDKTKIPRVAEMGNPDLIRLLMEARAEVQNGDGCLLPSECFAVSIPALSLHLFAYRDERTRQFSIVTLNDVMGQVKKKDFRTAKDVLKELSDKAKNPKYDQSNHRPNQDKQLVPTTSQPRRKNAITE